MVYEIHTTWYRKIVDVVLYCSYKWNNDRKRSRALRRASIASGAELSGDGPVQTHVHAFVVLGADSVASGRSSYSEDIGIKSRSLSGDILETESSLSEVCARQPTTRQVMSMYPNMMCGGVTPQ